MKWIYQNNGLRTNRFKTFVETKTLLCGTTIREFNNAAIVEVRSVTRKKKRPAFLLPLIPLGLIAWYFSDFEFGPLRYVPAVAGIGALINLACYGIFRGQAVYEFWLRPVNEKWVLAHSTEDWATAYEAYRESHYAIIGYAAKLDPEDEAACITILESRRAQGTT